MAVSFSFQKSFSLVNRNPLKQFIKKIFEQEGIQMGQISYIFCDNPYILDINRSFLSHDYYTDIITFDLSDTSFNKVSAEIYISIDMININALEFNVSFTEELHRVMFHGILHLCGYKDNSAAEKKMMRDREDHYLGLFASLS